MRLPELQLTIEELKDFIAQFEPTIDESLGEPDADPLSHPIGQPRRDPVEESRP